MQGVGIGHSHKSFAKVLNECWELMSGSRVQVAALLALLSVPVTTRSVADSGAPAYCEKMKPQTASMENAEYSVQV